MPDQVAARGPGRVNLIGEHTDYNAGLAMPFAIDRGVTVTATARDDGKICARALDLGETDEFALGEATGEDRRRRAGDDDGRGAGAGGGWRAFVRGTVGELQAAGYPLRGAALEITGDVPQGSGLSSSAAICTALCLAQLALAGERPPDDLRELAKLCSRVENEWVGQRTGLLDQFAALLSEPAHALKIDFRSLEAQTIPFDLGDWRLVTLDSGASHTLAASGYNERRAECEAACQALGIATLREAREEDLDRLAEPLRRRARHVITENARVEAMAAALADGELERAGELLDASHASLRDDYAASVPEVERTRDALKQAGAAGARMVGGGFGGSVLALLAPGVPALPGALAVAPGPPARLL